MSRVAGGIDGLEAVFGRRGDGLRGPDGEPAKLRLIVRRTRLIGAQGELWPHWRHHAFVTDRADLDTVAADAYHRGHATVELAMGHGLHHSPATHPRPAPAHLTRSPAPGAAQPHPTRHQPATAPTPRPHTPLNTPGRPHTPARHQPAQHRPPSQARRWIQA